MDNLLELDFVTVCIILVSLFGLGNLLFGEGNDNEAWAMRFAGLMMLAILAIGAYGLFETLFG